MGEAEGGHEEVQEVNHRADTAQERVVDDLKCPVAQQQQQQHVQEGAEGTREAGSEAGGVQQQQVEKVETMLK